MNEYNSLRESLNQIPVEVESKRDKKPAEIESQSIPFFIMRNRPYKVDPRLRVLK